MMKYCPTELHIDRNSSIKNLMLYVTNEVSIPNHPTPPPHQTHLCNFSGV